MADWILLGLAILGTGVFLWGCNKGFDITDEAIFFLQARDPHDVACYPFFDFAYSAPLHRLTKGNIVVHRIVLIVATVASCVVFSTGVADLLYARFPSLYPHSIKLALVSYIGSLLRFVFGPRLLYYNHVNSFALLALTGLLLSAFFGPADHSILLLLGVGALVGFQFFLKISSCLSTLVTLLVVAPLLASGDLYDRLAVTVPIGAGALIFCAFHFVCIQTPSSWWYAFSSQLKTAKLFTWGVSCLPRHMQEMKVFALKGLREYSRPLAVAVGAGTCVSALSFSSPMLVPCSAVVCLWAIVAFVERSILLRTWEPKIYDERLSSVTSLVALLLIACALAVPMLLIPQAKDIASADYRGWVALLFLGAIPFLGAVGTGNPLFVNTIFHHSTWYTIIAMIFVGWGQAIHSELVSDFLLLVLSAHAIKQTVYGMIKEPYRLVGPLSAQTETIEIGVPAVSIKMAPEAASFLRDFKGLLEANGFKPGDDLIALFDMPGLVYAVGARSPGHQWYYTHPACSEAMMEANKWHLSRVTPARLQHAFVVQKGDISFFHPHLCSLQMPFPHDYAVCGQLINPFANDLITLWKPFVAVTGTDACSRYRHTRLAERAIEAGLEEAAIQQMLEAVREQPSNFDLRLDVGNLLVNRKRPELACEHFSIALGLRENDPTAALGLALALAQTGNFSPARPLLEFVLARESRNVLALKILGCVATREGRTDEAKDLFERVLEIDPQDQDGLVELAVLCAESGDSVRAEGLARRITEITPDHPVIEAIRESIARRVQFASPS